MPCSIRNYGWIGLKPARCQESAAKTGFVNPLSRRDAADGRFQANPTGGGQGAVGFVARRQRMHPYAILLAPSPQLLGPPSTRNYGWNRALEREGTSRDLISTEFSRPANPMWKSRADRDAFDSVFRPCRRASPVQAHGRVGNTGWLSPPRDVNTTSTFNSRMAPRVGIGHCPVPG